MNGPAVRTAIADGVATVTLDRAAVHNAFDDATIAELIAALRAVAAEPSARCVVLAAAGRSYSAGADLAWMARMASYTEAENLADAMQLAELMRTLDGLPKPTVARVQGSAFGGGVGLVACCDIAVAARSAQFCLSEVRLGIVPAVISPYVVAAIGARAARRYFLTAERFDAGTAHALGLVHEVVPEEDLDAAVARVTGALLAGGPAALAHAKRLVARVSAPAVDDALVAETAALIARLRVSAEGREGLAAFLERRAPAWRAP